MYISVSTARCVFAMSPSLRRNSCHAAKENRDEKIIIVVVDRAIDKGFGICRDFLVSPVCLSL